MGGAESNHGAMMRPGTHSTSHRTTHSSAHRRATGTVSSVRQLTATLTATLTGPGLPCELKGAVGATRLVIGLSAGTEEGVHAFRDHRAVVTFGVLWAKAHNDPRRRYGSQL